MFTFPPNMEAAMSLALILISVQGGINYAQKYCINQPDSVQGVVGGSVTISCNFTYPKNLEPPTNVRVYWRVGSTSLCGNNSFVYNHTEKWTHENYTGRIFMEGNPKELKTASIRIRELRRTDGPMFCCRVELVNKEDTTIEQWQNRHGTFLRFPDATWVDQLDAVPAIEGENVTIPCYLHHPKDAKRTAKYVTWKKGDSDLCSENSVILTGRTEDKRNWDSRFSVLNSSADVSLHIADVKLSDQGQYCCEVAVNGSPLFTVHGTTLGVGDKNTSAPHKLKQAKESSATLGGSVTIKCTSDSSRFDLSWSKVYWRVGSPSGCYSYHPSTDMVDSTYKGRTELKGQTDLHIKGVKDTDNNTYYCLVMVKRCVGKNKYAAIIYIGEGTRLTVSDKKLKTNINQESPIQGFWDSYSTLIIASLCALVIVIILCVILIFLKRRGVICRKTANARGIYRSPQDPPQDRTDPTDEHLPGTQQVASEGLVYADLNMASLNKGSLRKNAERQPRNEVLYADVKSTQP